MLERHPQQQAFIDELVKAYGDRSGVDFGGYVDEVTTGRASFIGFSRGLNRAPTYQIRAVGREVHATIIPSGQNPDIQEYRWPLMEEAA